MDSSQKQYSLCYLFPSEYSRHLCIFQVYHSFSHWNPNHFFVQDLPGMEFSHKLCQNLSHSYFGCYQLRMRNQHLYPKRDYTPEEWSKSCMGLADKAQKLGCLMALGQYPVLEYRWPNAERSLAGILHRCEAFKVAEEQVACVFGVIANWISKGDPTSVRVIRQVSPCSFLKSVALLESCNLALQLPPLHWYDTLFVFNYAVDHGITPLHALAANDWILLPPT